MHSRGTFPGQTEDPRQSESSLAQMGTPRARHTGLALFSEPSSNISVCGSERRRVAASEATGQTSDCSYNHRGIGSQSVGGKCPAWRSGWEVSGPKLGWRDACGSGQRTCRSRRSGWTGSGWHAPPRLCPPDGRCPKHRTKRKPQRLRVPAVQRRGGGPGMRIDGHGPVLALASDPPVADCPPCWTALPTAPLHLKVIRLCQLALCQVRFEV